MASESRVSTVSTPKRPARTSSFWATARFIALSSAPPAVDAPPSSPPWPASIISVGSPPGAPADAGRAASSPPGSRKLAAMSSAARASGAQSLSLTKMNMYTPPRSILCAGGRVHYSLRNLSRRSRPSRMFSMEVA